MKGPCTALSYGVPYTRDVTFVSIPPARADPFSRRFTHPNSFRTSIFFLEFFPATTSYHNTCDTRNGLGHKLLQYAVMAATVDQKLLRATKFPPEFNTKVDMQKVNLQVMKK